MLRGIETPSKRIPSTAKGSLLSCSTSSALPYNFRGIPAPDDDDDAPVVVGFIQGKLGHRSSVPAVAGALDAAPVNPSVISDKIHFQAAGDRSYSEKSLNALPKGARKFLQRNYERSWRNHRLAAPRRLNLVPKTVSVASWPCEHITAVEGFL